MQTEYKLDLDALREQVSACTKCPLCQSRNNIVFGEGPANAEVMLVGEAPGRNEDEQGKPFVGRSGQLLSHLLASVDLDRERNIFITNILKCRPPENRDPQPDEMEACIDYLRGQVAFLRPKIIVCAGRIAAQRLISPAFKVTRQHGEFFEKNGVWMMGTYHPSALLRNPRQKPEALEDFLKLQEKIKEVCDHTY